METFRRIVAAVLLTVIVSFAASACTDTVAPRDTSYHNSAT